MEVNLTSSISASLRSQEKVTRQVAETPPEQNQASDASSLEQSLLVQQNAKTKLFNNGSVPIHGLYEVVLIDKNGDGRVDAGDAIPEYVKTMTQITKEKNQSGSEGKSVDRVA